MFNYICQCILRTLSYSPVSECRQTRSPRLHAQLAYIQMNSSSRPAMIDSSHETLQTGTAVDVCDRPGKSRTTCAERIPGCGELHFSSAFAGPRAPVRSGEIDAT